MECALLPLTDLGNAQRFVKYFGANFLFVDQWGWMAWDGKRWNAKEAEAILSRAVHDMVKAIAEEAHQIRLYSQLLIDHLEEVESGHRIDVVIDLKKDRVVYFSDKLQGWCMASQSNAHLSCVARLAQAYLTSSPDAFDVDDNVFNVANGTLRIKISEGGDYVTLSPHDRADMITKISEVEYDAAATCPVYDAFLNDVQPEPAMQLHLHAWGGLSLTGLPVARLSFWYGTGRNGKSTLIDAWAYVMGEYSQTIPIESFLDQGRSRNAGGATPDIASLPGVRCLRTSEPEKGAKLAESLVKLVTGGEPLRARHLNKDYFEFRPKFKLTMQGNYKPRIDGTDEGIWARLLIVPFTIMVAAEKRDAELPQKLKAEASGILNRLLDGLCEYLDHGLRPPDEVLEATQDYREDSDPIGQFLKDCTTPAAPDAGARVTGKDMYALYVAWARAMGEKPWGNKGFSRGLQDHGIRRLKSSGIFYLNITLTRHVDEFRGHEIEVDHDKTD